MTKYFNSEDIQRPGYRQFPVLLGLLIALFSPVSSFAHGQGDTVSANAKTIGANQKRRAEELTQQLGNLIAEDKSANDSEKSNLAGQIAGIAEERWQLLGNLIENDPAEVLNQALPDHVLDQMPAKSQVFLEQRLEMEGELQLLHVDYTDDSQSHYVYLLTTDEGEKFSLHFAKELPDMLSGERIRAKGLALYNIKTRDTGETDGAVAVDDEEGDLVLLEAGKGKKGGSGGSSNDPTTLPNTLGAQKTLVILVNFFDNATEPYTPATAQDMLFNTVSNFYLESSYQQTWITGDVVGWFTISTSSTVCNTGAIESEASTAASEVVNLSAYDHLIYAFPQNNNCSWAGLSSVGGSPSNAWINGNFEERVVAHELSHGLGLWHSHSLNCGTTTLGSNCTTVEYGDIVDTMGGPIGFKYAAHFNAFQKERLGWLNAGISPEITTVESDGTYTLETYESPDSGPKALKILKSTDPDTGKRTWYYLESRQGIGFDSFLATHSSIASSTNITNGILLHMGTESSGNTSHLLDLHPDTSNWWDPAIAVGENFEDPDAGVTMTTDWVTGTGAAVTVSFGSGGGSGGGGSTNEPTMGVSTDKTNYSVGQNVLIGATVTSGGEPVANASVNFTITKSDGKLVNGNATTGSDGAAVYKLRLKRRDPSGIYEADASTTINGKSGSAATTFTVQ